MARLLLAGGRGRRSRSRGRARGSETQEAVEEFCGQLALLAALNPRLRNELGYTREVPFAQRAGRQWRADVALLHFDILIEVEGGIWQKNEEIEVKDGKPARSGGRHNHPLGYEADCEKYSWASILGHTLVRGTTGMVYSGKLLELVVHALRERHGLALNTEGLLG